MDAKKQKNIYLTDKIARKASRRRTFLSYTVHDPKVSHPKVSHFFIFCFIIGQKWCLLGKCSQSVPLFQRILLKKVTHSRYISVIVRLQTILYSCHQGPLTPDELRFAPTWGGLQPSSRKFERYLTFPKAFGHMLLILNNYSLF